MTPLIQDAFVGLSMGAALGFMALGVVIVYRGSGVVNFSQGAIGMVGTYVFWELRVNHGIGLVPSVLAGVLAGALVGVLAYVLVISRLQSSGEVVKVVATVGLLITLESAAVLRYGVSQTIVGPLVNHAAFRVLGGELSPSTAIAVVALIVVAGGLSLLFNRTKLGMMAIAIRENPNATSAVGISPHPIGLITWSVGGAVGALAGILIVPITGLSPYTLTLLVVPALAAGLLVKFNMIFLTAVIGMLIGVLEAELQLKFNVSTSLISAIPFILIIIALIFRGQSLPGRGHLQAIRLPQVSEGAVRLKTGVAVLVATLIAVQLVGGDFALAMVTSALAGILGLSIVLITGFAGQVNLAPLALAGLGSLIAARLSADAGLPFPLAVVLAAISTMFIGVAMGAPAVRVRGVSLAIASLGLALLVEQSILATPSISNGSLGIVVPLPVLFGWHIDPGTHPSRYAIVTVVLFAACFWAVMNVRRSASGRRYLAVRANERGAAALGISVPGAKLRAFAVSSFLAGIAGAMMTFEFSTVTFDSYTTLASISLVAFAFVAGVGFPSGGIIVGLVAVGGVVPYLIENRLGFASINNWLALGSGLFVLTMMTRNPDGVMSMNAKALGRLRLTKALSLHGRTNTKLESGGLAPAGRPGRPSALIETGTPPAVLEVSGVDRDPGK
jgi:branched-subunit amino acid ABC-type transport system permease component